MYNKKVILVTFLFLLIMFVAVWKIYSSNSAQNILIVGKTPKAALLQTPINPGMASDPVGSTTLINSVGTLTPPPNKNNISSLISAGTGTTTLNKATPFNDILIAETGSPYASLRNARYTVWPYPGEIPLQEIYLILPDVYEPIFSGYSNKQFLESMDGGKHVVIHLRHKQSTDIGPDAHIFIQSPINADDLDHSITLIESTKLGAVYSIVSKNKEVILEVTFSENSELSPDLLHSARAELLRSIMNIEIIF
jgi:hypothetical protein